MYSIGLDISKSSVNVHIPLTQLDLEIENSLTSFKVLYAKLKKLYKKAPKNDQGQQTGMSWLYKSIE